MTGDDEKGGGLETKALVTGTSPDALNKLALLAGAVLNTAGCFAMDGVDTLWIIPLVLYAAAFVTASRCTFPIKWRGAWYENGLGEINIGKHTASHKGHCVSSDKKKYLLLDNEKKCFVCLVFTPQHENLLQYKESYCVNDDDLSRVCSAITGDFPLHTIVKVSGHPIPCPFQGSYSFSYTNGSVEEWCREPSSEIKACADRSRFIFSYKRCKDLPYTRDTELTFQCLAKWFNGMEQFLYGKFTSKRRPDRTHMYRCFMYSLYGGRGDMSMSQDATCQGLSDPGFGMNTFSLQNRKEEWPQPECAFPHWLVREHAWRDVAGKWRMTVDENGQELSLHHLLHPDFLVPGELTPATVLRIRCLEVKLTSVGDTTTFNTNLQHVLTFATNDSCVSTLRCIRLKQRAEEVFEMRIGSATDDAYLACEDTFFTRSKTYVFFPHKEEGVKCPRNGSYMYFERQGDCTGSLDIGCERQSQMLLHATCSREQAVEILQCYQMWTEGSQQYIIAVRPGSTGSNYSPAYCLMLQDVDKDFTLQEAGNCEGGGIRIMNRPVDYVVSGPKDVCEQRTLPTPFPGSPHVTDGSEGQHTDDTSTSRLPDAKSKDSSPTDLTKVKVINNSNTRTCASYMIFLCTLLTVLLNER